jgi:hypothetical protein
MSFRDLFTFILLLATCFTQSACKQNNTPSQTVTMRSNEARKDSLFFGYFLGMTHPQFMDNCKKMNQSRILKDGSTGINIQYQFKKGEFKHDARMEFFPEFKDGKIAAMPTEFMYEGWSPWNRELSADSILTPVVSLMSKWYGEGFKTSQTKMGETVYEKTESNRHIKISRLDERKVRVMITDLVH